MNERLEELKQFAGILIEKHVNEGEYHPEQMSAMAWAIEQAERTQELESECADRELGHKQLQNDFEGMNPEKEGYIDYLQDENERLEQQNKRYRELLINLQQVPKDHGLSCGVTLNIIKAMINDVLEGEGE